MGRGGQRGFVGVTKYFRHIWMGHDGPQNIFLCSIFVTLFFKLKGIEGQNIKTSQQGDLRKT